MTNKEFIEQINALKEDISNKQKETGDKVEKILFILESDPKINTKGLVEKVNDNQKEIKALKEGDVQNLKDFKNDINTKIKVGGFIGGSLAAAAAFFFKWLFKM